MTPGPAKGDNQCGSRTLGSHPRVTNRQSSQHVSAIRIIHGVTKEDQPYHIWSASVLKTIMMYHKDNDVSKVAYAQQQHKVGPCLGTKGRVAARRSLSEHASVAVAHRPCLTTKYIVAASSCRCKSRLKSLEGLHPAVEVQNPPKLIFMAEQWYSGRETRFCSRIFRVRPYREASPTSAREGDKACGHPQAPTQPQRNMRRRTRAVLIEDDILLQLDSSSILMMDNAPIHRSDELRELVEAASHHLEYLPSYSSNFNPIEQYFSMLKAWIRRHRDLIAHFDDFGDFLIYTMYEKGGRSARGQFKHSGYFVGHK
ncbi:hypothetical protein ANO11243_054190 [Dothideomycetidae sp. 11243]|nr:hypothetical protein ANO11243_054190 [fungal sp. No.11243]